MMDSITLLLIFIPFSLLLLYISTNSMDPLLKNPVPIMRIDSYMSPKAIDIPLKNIISKKEIDSRIKLAYTGEEVLSSSKVPSEPSYCHPVPLVGSNTHKDDLQDRSLPYVSITDGGRFGNKLCQYATVWIIREIFGIRVAVAKGIHPHLLTVFQKLSIPMVDSTYHKSGAINIHFDVLYDNLLSNYLRRGNLQKVGYSNLLGASYIIRNNACPRDLMWLYRDKLRQELVFKSSIMKSATDNMNEALQALGTTRENNTLVTVHVRRTDYKAWLKKCANADLINKQYFKRAFTFYRNKYTNPVFLVMSDDPKWCKIHLKDHDVKIVSSSPSIDFALLTLGDHHIRSVGTFGYASAVLGHGGMVYPANYSKTFAYEDVLECSDLRGLSTLHSISVGNASRKLQ